MLPSGAVSVWVRTLGEEGGIASDRWFAFAPGDVVLVGHPPLDNIGILETAEVPNEP